MLDQDIFPEDSLSLTFGMRNVEGNYVTGLTHATAGHGTATLTGDTFTRQFRLGPHRPADRARRQRPDPQLCTCTARSGEFNVHVDGAMPDVMALIDMKPLSYPTRFGIDPKTDQRPGQHGPDLQGADAGGPAGGRCRHPVKAQVNEFAVSLGKMRLDQWRGQLRHRQ